MLTVAFAPDGKTIASGDYGNQVCLWNTNTGSLQATLDVHADKINCVAFTETGRLAWASWGTGCVEVYDSKSRTVKRVLSLGKQATGCFARDGSAVAAIDNLTGHLALWRLSGQKRASSTEPKAVARLRLSPDGSTLAEAHYDGSITLRETATMATRWTTQPHQSIVYCLAFSPDGQTLASGSAHEKVEELAITEVASGRTLAVLQGSYGALDSAVFSADGRTVIAGSSADVIQLFDVPRMRPPNPASAAIR